VLVKAMRRPSGDQVGAQAVAVPMGSLRWPVPLARMMMMLDPFAVNLAQAIWRSSGDHAGC
jgi:hypothetical protein